MSSYKAGKNRMDVVHRVVKRRKKIGPHHAPNRRIIKLKDGSFIHATKGKTGEAKRRERKD